MKQLINWRKWEDEKPDEHKPVLSLHDNIELIGVVRNNIWHVRWCPEYLDVPDNGYWCYTSELIPEEKTKYKSVEEFFTKPIKGWIDLEEHTAKIVDLQKEVIDVAIGFGKFILENQINTYTADEDSETFFDWNGDLFSNAELFNFYTKQLEAEKLNPDV